MPQCAEEVVSKTGRGDEDYDDLDILRILLATEPPFNHKKAIDRFKEMVAWRGKMGLAEIHKKYSGVPWRSLPHWDKVCS